MHKRRVPVQTAESAAVLARESSDELRDRLDMKAQAGGAVGRAETRSAPTPAGARIWAVREVSGAVV
jgi:hypothetical protein